MFFSLVDLCLFLFEFLENVESESLQLSSNFDIFSHYFFKCFSVPTAHSVWYSSVVRPLGAVPYITDVGFCFVTVCFYSFSSLNASFWRDFIASSLLIFLLQYVICY